MLDIKSIRDKYEELQKKLQSKDSTINLSHILDLDEKLRSLKTETDQLKAQRNSFSKKIGEYKRSGKDTHDLMDQVSTISERVHKLDTLLQETETTFSRELSALPNIPMDDVKQAEDPAENVCIKSWGEKPSFPFPFKNHLELNEQLELFDFERGAKISGTSWPVYKGLGAQLEWALINFMLEHHIKNGFTQWIPPLLVREETLFASGQLPKFADQQFRITDEDYNLWMIPTAEVPLNGLHIEEIIPEEELPKKYVSYTPCFRREAGAAGKNERGLIRVHQFNKVEMFCFTAPEKSCEMFEQMLASAEAILEALGLHYRSMLLVTGDMSFGAAKTVDVEVWLPGQERYYEVSSISNCTDFQARRSNTRMRKNGEKPEFLHTLNGSGLATSRLMVALLENNQNEDGSVNIPKPLQKYLGGIEVLRSNQ